MNKVLFSMLVLLMSVLAKVQASTEVWSGEFKADNWNAVLDVAGNSFSSLKVGDQVVFSGAADGGAQIQIADNDWKNYITAADYNCVDFNGTYTVDVDENNLAVFQGGIHVKGQNFTLQSISVVAKEKPSEGGEAGDTGDGGEGWKGNFRIDNWNSTPLDVAGTAFSSLKVGDQVVFKGIANGGAQIQIADNDWKNYITASQYNCVDFNGTYTVDVDEDNLALFQGGIHIKGTNFTLQSISIVANDTPEDEGVIGWTGNFEAAGWNGTPLDVKKSRFSTLKVGDQVIFTGTVKSGAQIQVANNDWKKYITASTYNCVDFDGTYTVDVTEDNLAIFQGGIHVQGVNFTLQSIRIKTWEEIKEENKGNAWWGNFNAGSDWEPTLEVDGSVFADLKVGDLVVFKGDVVTDYSTNTPQIQIADSNFKKYVTENKYNCVGFTGKYTAYVDESNIDIFKGGIAVKGQNIILKTISIEHDTYVPPVIAKGSFYVDGTKLMDANGNEFVMRGVNYPFAWYKGVENTVIPAAKRIGCNTIRISISNGQKFTYSDKSEVKNLIRLCESNKLVCVLCVHDALGSNQISDLDKTVDYWKGIKDLLVGHEGTVIVNISNEWVAQWAEGTAVWEEGYVKAIKELREAGIKNTLMVDCAGYGQYPAVIGTNGRTVFEADPMRNTMFSMHLYQDAGGTAEDVRANIKQALDIKVPVCVGEFAYSHKGTPVAYQTIMDYCQEKNVGYLVWSWTGNTDGTEACDMFGGWDETDVKENGRLTVYGKNGIQETSKECSVFSGSATNVESVRVDGSENIDFNHTYEIYNLNGQRVQNMNSHGVYILRQGNKCVKVRK